MTIFTIGFTKKSAETFFHLIKSHNIETLIDIRLNNSSQLAGFSKGSDLAYFLDALCQCDYVHETIFAPTKELRDDFKNKKIALSQFETRYRRLAEEREAVPYFKKHYAGSHNVCLLCSEETSEHCHRRILADMLAKGSTNITIQHL